VTTRSFALTRDGFDWKPIPLTADEFASKVAAFRQGLDVGELNLALEHSQKPPLFDLALAHELYRALLAPIRVLGSRAPCTKLRPGRRNAACLYRGGRAVPSAGLSMQMIFLILHLGA
jgi:hypothetical protein